ncbi:MAG: hypothetical protein WED00_05915 [Aquisalimonadaceae bacterium]
MNPLLLEPPETAQLGVVAFHDAGATPAQFRQAFSAWRSVLPPAVFYAPRAPLPCDPAVGGYTWYSLEGIDVHNRAERLAEGVELARGILARFGRQFGLQPHQVVAAGYSQGAVILLGLAAESGNAHVGQLLSFVGQPLPEEVPVEQGEHWPRVDIFHGDQDDVIPVAYANALFRWLSQHGAEPTLFVESDTGHELAAGSISKAGERMQVYLQGL